MIHQVCFHLHHVDAVKSDQYHGNRFRPDQKDLSLSAVLQKPSVLYSFPYPHTDIRNHMFFQAHRHYRYHPVQDHLLSDSFCGKSSLSLRYIPWIPCHHNSMILMRYLIHMGTELMKRWNHTDLYSPYQFSVLLPF